MLSLIVMVKEYLPTVDIPALNYINGVWLELQRQLRRILGQLCQMLLLSETSSHWSTNSCSSTVNLCKWSVIWSME